MINGRKHYLICWENPNYQDEYIDIPYMQMMEDILKLKHKWHSPGEIPLSPKQCNSAASRRKEALKRMCKTRALQRTPPKPTLEERLQAVAQPKGSSPKQWRTVKEDDMLDLNIDPFFEESVQQQGGEEDIQASQKRPPKPPLEERLKPPPLEE